MIRRMFRVLGGGTCGVYCFLGSYAATDATNIYRGVPYGMCNANSRHRSHPE